MSKIKNKKFYEIALEVGGSHYPDVGGELLEKYGESIVRKCAEIARLNTRVDSKVNEMIKDHFGVE
jgi:hypothetical protein